MKRWLFLFTTSLLLSCSPKVISYLDSDADFKNFNSFRIVSVKLDGRKVAPESIKMFDDIKLEIMNQMLDRSYVQSNISPDLTLRYELSSSTRSTGNTNNNNFNNPIGYPPSYSVTNSTIHESIILLELYDAKKKLIWQGSYDLKNEKKEQKTTKVIKNAIDQIFTTYPYKSGRNTIYQELTNKKKKKND
jgi:hypothetical protein